MASTLALTLGDRLRISRSTVGNITDTRSSEQPPSPHQDLDSERLASPGTVPELAGADNDQGGVEYILQLQEDLDSLPSDDPSRPTQLFLLGCAIADHHVKAGIEGTGDMLKAIKLLEEGIAVTPEEKIARCSIFNALQNMCWSLYQTAGDATHLDESIKYERLAVGPEFPSDLEDQHTLLSQRYALALSRSLKERFEIAVGDGQNIADLNEAWALLALSITGEVPKDHETRLSELCSINALRTEATDDIRFLDGVIDLRRRHSLDVIRGRWNNHRGLVALLGRRYEWTMEKADLDILI